MLATFRQSNQGYAPRIQWPERKCEKASRIRLRPGRHRGRCLAILAKETLQYDLGLSVHGITTDDDMFCVRSGSHATAKREVRRGSHLWQWG